MSKRVCVFVDGENLRHSIVEAFRNQELFESYQYLPPRANWGDFFDWIVEEVTESRGRRLRAYWYMIDGLAFHPYGLKNLKNPGKERKAREILSKNRAFRAELSGLMERQIIQKVERSESGHPCPWVQQQ